MSKPDYGVHDPLGWCGDPKRGAAMGRPTIIRVDPEAFTGRVHLSLVALTDLGDYDDLGTYWGAGLPLYWAANHESDEHVDFVVRATNREDAKRQVLLELPKARFYR